MTNTILCIFPDSFWINFWPNFFSSLVAGGILTFIITRIVTKLRQPKLEVILTVMTSTLHRRTLQFYCINTGNTGLMPNEIQWHLYFDECFKPLDNPNDYILFIHNNRSFYQFTGMSNSACLPGSSCLLFSINVVTDPKTYPYDTIDSAPFYYSLTTINGQKQQSTFFSKAKDTDFIEDISTIKRRIFRITKISI